MWVWWWVWIAVVFCCVFVPLTYGRGRRGWGPPYPTYYRRRHYVGRTVAPVPGDPSFADPAAPVAPGGAPLADPGQVDRDPDRYPGYGVSWDADLLWLGVLAAIGWAVFLWVS